MVDEPQRRYPVAGDATITLCDGSTRESSASSSIDVSERDLATAVIRAPGARGLVVCERSHRVDDLVRAGAAAAWSCVMIGMGGSPTPTMRHFIRSTSAALGVPAFVLADYDPGGLDVFFLVQRGTSGLRRCRAELAVPNARYLGLRSEHAAKVQETFTIDLSEAEQRRLVELARHPWIRSDPFWRHEIAAMRKRGRKVELEAAACSEGIDAFVASLANEFEARS